MSFVTEQANVGEFGAFVFRKSGSDLVSCTASDLSCRHCPPGWRFLVVTQLLADLWLAMIIFMKMVAI